MPNVTVSTLELFEMIPDQAAARRYLERRLWPHGPKCPVCGLGERITVRKDGFYRCNQCKEDFTVRTGTILERSHIPLHKWVYAMYLEVSARKGIPSLQLSKEIGITQKSAWFMLQRLREACGSTIEKLRREIDEIDVGGTGKNKHERNKLKAGRGTVDKTAVFAMRERGRRTMAVPVTEGDSATIRTDVQKRIAVGAVLPTEEAQRLSRTRIRARDGQSRRT
jgi:transposase-like protein